MRSIQFATGEYYHLFNRAVEGREIFHMKRYTSYFLESLVVCNTKLDMNQHWRRDQRNRRQVMSDPLVEIAAFVLMPNHFHLLVRQLVDDGIPKLLQRACNSFAKYVNTFESRKGGLFMGPYQAVHISSDSQASHLFTYIHANPLDLRFPRWREGKVLDWDNAKHYLESYESSSLPLYLERGSVHPLARDVIAGSFAKAYYKKSSDHMNAIQFWSERGAEQVSHLTLE